MNTPLTPFTKGTHTPRSHFNGGVLTFTLVGVFTWMFQFNEGDKHMHPLHLAITVASLVVSPADENGFRTLSFSPGVQAIYMAGPLKGPFHQDDILPAPQGRITRVCTFLGWDRGSIGEANLEINISGFRLYQRSEHKESPINYDAWKCQDVNYMPTSQSPLIHMAQDAWMTAPNHHDGGLSTRVEMSIRITIQTIPGK